ncbi:MAG: cysteine--tRNA ligase [Actinomycetaceae bacterium]|nr:cysteine--tRNA ligase [Actinomycetaceae bacterium]MDY6082478.1 cysteine--tRNA ligase [Actinomycetaceae bacterium]
MSISVYDSKSRELREFHPLEPGKVGIYLCGATVQGSPHIGHMRSAVAFDVLRRWLTRSGYDVTLVRNVTDIDDKILAKSAEAGQPWWAWAYRFEREFTDAYNILGVLPPTYEPRATGHIPQMIELIHSIIDAGHAYVGNPGNVYFDVASLPDYGSLTHQNVSDMTVDQSDMEPDKRNPHDFALWKAAKPTEPHDAAWDTPWGRGRPGWHIECSTMSGRYLGSSFDIHAGGIDLRFPHHENEQAQSHAAGREFARYWMHNAWVTIDGEKMSKSLGNSLIVQELVKSVPAAILRFALSTVHYRSTVAYSDATLANAANQWNKMAGFVKRAADKYGEVPSDELAEMRADDYPESFRDAMDDDLNVAGALATVYEELSAGNTALAESDASRTRLAQKRVRAMLDVLGLDPLARPWRDDQTVEADTQNALSTVVDALLERRAQAREEKNWDVADGIRSTLTQAGIVVEDSAQQVHWHVA